MHISRSRAMLSATDLANHLRCRHLTQLDLRCAKGDVEKPYRDDPGLEVLREKGDDHERAYSPRELDGGTLPIQGPPDSGKAHTGARMIAEFVKQGKRIGVSAVSHKVIDNLLQSALGAAVEEAVELRCLHKVTEKSAESPADIAKGKDSRSVESVSQPLLTPNEFDLSRLAAQIDPAGPLSEFPALLSVNPAPVSQNRTKPERMTVGNPAVREIRTAAKLLHHTVRCEAAALQLDRCDPHALAVSADEKVVATLPVRRNPQCPAIEIDDDARGRRASQ